MSDTHAARLSDLRARHFAGRGRPDRPRPLLSRDHAWLAATRAAHRGAARELIAAAILVGSALVGDWLFRTLPIGLPAFRIAGGLLLFSIASEMVFGGRTGHLSQQAEQAVPRARAQYRRLSARHAIDGRTWRDHCDHPAGEPQRRRHHAAAILPAVIAVVLVLCFVVFVLAAQIAKRVGVAANIASRLLGVLLAALAVQYVVDGVRAAQTALIFMHAAAQDRIKRPFA